MNARPEHKAVGRMAVHCLTLHDDLDAWHGLSLVATARLDPSERARLAWATLRSLTPEDADLVIEAVFGPPVGAPDPSFQPITSEGEVARLAALTSGQVRRERES